MVTNGLFDPIRWRIRHLYLMQGHPDWHAGMEDAPTVSEQKLLGPGAPAKRR